MRFIYIDGIGSAFPEEITGTDEWYSCKIPSNDFCDLFEAEEMARFGKIYPGMNCKLIHYPDGKVYSPFQIKENVYVDTPVYDRGVFYFLVVDFSKEMIRIFSYRVESNQLNQESELDLATVEDCYNLMLQVSPVTLVRDGNDGLLEIIWPEKHKIAIGDTESLCFRDGDNLYCCEWNEEPEYHEYVIVRDYHTGRVKEKYIGQMRKMPNGDVWITKG